MMVIENRQQLEFTQKRIAQLELLLDGMRQEETPKAYAVFQQGFVALIDQMRQEIDEYLGIVRDAEVPDEVIEALATQLAKLSQSGLAVLPDGNKPPVGDAESAAIMTR